MKPFGKDPFKDASESHVSHRSDINLTNQKSHNYKINIDASLNFSNDNLNIHEQQSPTFHVSEQQNSKIENRFMDVKRHDLNKNFLFEDSI